ncbi:MAG: hypothetical protein R3C56_17480 [Pirellulaceae bacterium]
MILLTTAIDLTMQLAGGMRLLSGVDRYRVWTALQHAASNAIYRGNLELTRDQWQQSSSRRRDGGRIDCIRKPATQRRTVQEP